MKTATIEILSEGELVFSSKVKGQYFVREYEDGLEMGGAFFLSMGDAEAHVREYQDGVKVS